MKPGQQALGKPRRGERGRYPKHPRRGRSPLGGFSIRTSAARKDPEPAASPRPGGSPQPPPLPAPSGRDEFDRPQPGRDAVKAGLRRRRFRGGPPGRPGPRRAGGRVSAGVPAWHTRGGLWRHGRRGKRGPLPSEQPPLETEAGRVTKYLDGNKGTSRSKGKTPNPERASRVERLYCNY